MKILLILLFIAFLNLTSFGQSPDPSYVGRNKESLINVNEIKLVVSYILPGTESLISKSSVISLVEKHLRKRGIIVLNTPFSPKSNVIPTLHVVVSMKTYGEDEENLLYSVIIELSQEAILIRDKEIQSPVITWQTSFHGTGTAFNLNPVTRQIINYLDFFIEDWEIINKKQRKRIAVN